MTIPRNWQAAPFQLRLADGSDFHAEQIVRVLPHRRLVAFGTWQNKPVVAKLFFDARFAKRDKIRDLSGIQSLHDKNIPAPALCLDSTSEDGLTQVLIYERIHHATSLLEKWQTKKSMNEILPALQSVMVEIATQHVLGVLQHDLHLSNFLLTKKKIYTLDGAQIETFPLLLSKKQSMKNLALFLSQLGVGIEEYQEKLFRHYAKARGWLLKKFDLISLFYQIKKWDEKRWRRYQKKIFRSCTNFSRHKDLGWNGMYDRSYGFSALKQLLEDPEKAFQASANVVLKAGRSTTVIKVKLNDQEFVIKRYNMKSIWHYLRRCLRPTRAATSWRLGHKLHLFNVLSAKPVAFIEAKWFGLRGKSYYVSEFISAEHLGSYFQRHYPNTQKIDEMVQKTAALLKKLAKLEMTHGDLKMTNILVDAQEEPHFIDLDGTVEHATMTGLKKTWQEDIQRFLLNFSNMPTVVEKFKTAMMGT